MPAVMDAVRNMSTDEKFSVINMIWRDIASSSDIPVPEWHLDLLRKREQEVASGSVELLDWTNVRAEIQKRSIV